MNADLEDYEATPLSSHRKPQIFSHTCKAFMIYCFIENVHNMQQYFRKNPLKDLNVASTIVDEGTDDLKMSVNNQKQKNIKNILRENL